MEIAKELGHDHRAVKKLAINPAHYNGRSDWGKIRKKTPVLHRAMNHIMKEKVRGNPLQASIKKYSKVLVFLMCPKQLDAVF